MGKELCCNKCGRKLKMEGGILKEGACEVVKEWGFFSKKDLEIHRFNLCEDCYDKITGDFVIPVDIEEMKEVL